MLVEKSVAERLAAGRNFYILIVHRDYQNRVVDLNINI